MFELPRGITGFGLDHPQSELAERRRDFVAWARSVASAFDSTAIELPLGDPIPSFDLVKLERVDHWLLHNRFVPVVGVLANEPEPGTSWAVAGEYVDLELPGHLAGWGPRLLDAADLNAPLTQSLESLGLGAVEQADRYKPETIGHVVFNYWT